MRCQGLGPGSVPRARRNSTRPLSQVGKWAGTGLGRPGSHSRFLVSCSFAQMSIQDTLCQGLANKPRAAGKGPSLPRGRGEQEAFGLSEKLSKTQKNFCGVGMGGGWAPWQGKTLRI